MTAFEQRLKWKCRRGLLELDLVLEKFLQREDLSGDTLTSLHAFLDLPDNDLWDIISGRSDRYDARFAGLVERLRAA